MPTLKTFVCKIKLPNGQIQEVSEQANSFFNAKAMLEMKYGKKSLWTQPKEVK